MEKNIAIATPQQSSYSETFIKQHIAQLNGRKTVYYGGFLPRSEAKKGILDKKSYSAKILNKAGHRFNGSDLSYKEYLLYKSLKKNNIQLILAEHGPTGAACLKVARALNIPMIIHFHGADAFRHDLLGKFSNAYREAFAYASYVVAVSGPMREQLISLGCPREKLLINTYGPHPMFLETSCALKGKTLVAIGRFVDKKAPYYTMLAFRKALEKHPDAKLVMAGEGPLHSSCVNLARYWNLGGSVEFRGIVTPEEVVELFQSSFAFVQHSIIAANGDSEGSPVVIIEASAAGLPVIATRHAGIPEVILDGETGLLVNEHEVDGMAAAMIRLLDNPSYAQQLGKAGKARIREHFSLKKHINVLDELIDRCLRR